MSVTTANLDLVRAFEAYKRHHPAQAATAEDMADIPPPPCDAVRITPTPKGWKVTAIKARPQARPPRHPRPVRRIVRSSRRMARAMTPSRAKATRTRASAPPESGSSSDPDAAPSQTQRPHPVRLRDSEQAARAHGLTPKAVAPLGANCKARRVTR
jgi:hypothetical protein